MTKMGNNNGDKQRLMTLLAGAESPRHLMTIMRDYYYPDEQMQDPFRKVGVNASDGPMLFLADIICKKMEKAGFPSIIHCGYRPPEEQKRLYDKRPRVTRAKPYESAHQFYEAVDIVHKSLFWNASPQYWETLANCVRTVSKEFNVSLEHGHNWKFVDSAHIELKSWRDVRDRQYKSKGYHYVPTQYDLNRRFEELLPAVWASHKAQTGGQVPIYDPDTGKIDYPI